MICPYCKENRPEGKMPLEIKMMIAENMVDAVCEQCVERSPALRAGVEKNPIQDRLWYNGHKYLRYGTFFAEV
jgi:hypothetical protein